VAGARRSARLTPRSLLRWLLDNDHDEEGMVVIANLYGEGDHLGDSQITRLPSPSKAPMMHWKRSGRRQE
jgi:hypothetical protein